jgi:hypothetical protein
MKISKDRRRFSDSGRSFEKEKSREDDGER